MSIISFAKRATLVVAMTAALGACASSQVGGGNTVSRDATRSAATVEYGVVIDARQVTIEGTRSGVGAATGAVAGGIAGSQIGGGTEERAVAGVAGAVVGGLIGDAVEEGVTSQKGIEYTVRSIVAASSPWRRAPIPSSRAMPACRSSTAATARRASFRRAELR